jgi:hypothetical protein
MTLDQALIWLRQVAEFLNYISPSMTAIATVAIAAFTLTLWRATTEQGRLTRESIQLARDEFNATHRPRISVRGFRTLAETVGDAEVSTTFIYANVGDLPAKIVEIRTNVTIDRTLPSGLIFVRHKIEHVTLASGEKETFAINDNSMEMHFHRTTNQDRPPSSVPSTAYVTGVIVYEDTAGRRRETGFCRVNNDGIDRWLLAEHSEYEYQD